jgi:TPR repeat protein
VKCGHHFSKEKKQQEALYYYAAAARQGDPEGQFYYGMCFENGSGVEKNLVAALWFYRLADKQGFGGATLQAKLSVIITQVETLKSQKEIYEQQLLVARAQLFSVVGLASLERFFSVEIVEINRLMKIVSQKPEPNNRSYWTNYQYMLGLRYHYGISLAPDLEKAAMLYGFAERAGHPGAARELSKLR